MAVSTQEIGKFKVATGTLEEVVGQLNDDSRVRDDMMLFEQDSSGDYVAVYQNR